MENGHLRGEIRGFRDLWILNVFKNATVQKALPWTKLRRFSCRAKHRLAVWSVGFIEKKIR